MTGVPSQLDRVAEDAARDQRFDLLVEQVVDYAIFLLDPQGRVMTWNPGAERIKGYSAQEIIGQPYATFFGEEDRQQRKPETILAHARTQGRYQEEGWRIRKDGSRFWASAVLTALHDDTGALTGFAKITRDLTERLREEENRRRLAAETAARRQAQLDQEEIRRSRDQLDLILKSISEGVTVQAPDGRLVFANQAAAELSGYHDVDEMLAAPSRFFIERFELLTEAGTPFPVEELPGRKAFEGKPSRALVRFRRKHNGPGREHERYEERWSLVSAAPVFNPSGNVDLVVNVFRDITDAKKVEQGWQFLAQASAVLGSSLEYDRTLAQLARMALPSLADGCTIELLGAGGDLQQIETAHRDPAKTEQVKRWRSRPGSGPGALTLQVFQTGKPALLPEITEAMVASVSSDPEYQRFVKAMGVRSGMVVPITQGDQPIGVISFVMAESGRRYGQQDLSLALELARRAALAIENSRAYRAAQAAIQIRDTFLSIASHELRTPLASLSIITTSLLRMAEQGRLLQLGEARLKDRLVKVDRQAQQLTELTNRLLDVTRLSSPDLRLELGQLDLGEMAREVVARFEDAAGEARCSLHLDAAAGPVIVEGDRGRLDQVLSNLIGNAIKYAPGSPVRVSVGRDDREQAHLVVADEGPGISAEHHERIFRQFERAVSANIPGMGLGLWIVRRIVDAHGGTVVVESAPGKGTRFTVSLPVRSQLQEVG